MRFNKLAAIISSTTVTFFTLIPVQAATIYQVNSGVTSVYHDLLELSNIGINLSNPQDTIPPVTDSFLLGFKIAPSTNFTFSDANGITPIAGTIQHFGTVVFNSQTIIGNFSIGYDPTRAVNGVSGFFLKDTVSTNTVLFDLSIPANSVAFNGKNLSITNVDLLISLELASILNNPSLAGVLGGTARLDADVAPVPEPGTVLASIFISVALMANKRSSRHT